MLVILWVISPIVLIPILISLRITNKKLKRFINDLAARGRISESERTSCTISDGQIVPQAPFVQNNMYVNPNTYSQNPNFGFDHKSAPCCNAVSSGHNAAENSYAPQTPPVPQSRIADAAELAQRLSYMQPSRAPETNVLSGAQSLFESGKSAVSSISVILLIGVVFIVLAGIIFAKTTWVKMSDIARIASLSSFSVLFYGVCALAHKKLNLKRTGMAFFALGSIFMPIAIIASGYFELLGEYFSTGGDGSFLVYAFSAFALFCAGLIGAKAYRSRVYAVMCLGANSLFMLFLSLWAFNTDAASLVMSVYALGLMLLSQKTNEKASVFADVIVPFSLACTFFLSLFSFPENSLFSAFASFIFACAFLTPVSEQKLKGFSALPVTVMLICGSVRAFDGFANSIIFSLALTAVLLMLLGCKPKIGDTLKKIYMVFAVCIFAVHAGASLIITLLVSCDNAAQFLSTLVTFITIAVCAKLKNSRLLYNCLPIYATAFSVQIISYYTDFSETGCIILTFLMISAFLIFANLKKLHTSCSDICFLTSALITSFLTVITIGEDKNTLLFIALIEAYLTVLCAVFTVMRKNNLKISAHAAALAVPAFAANAVFCTFVYADMPLNMQNFAFAWLVLLASIGIVFSQNIKKSERAFTFISCTAFVCISGFIFAWDKWLSAAVPLLAALLCAYIFVLAQKHKSEIFSHISLFAFFIYLCISVSAACFTYFTKNEAELSFCFISLAVLIFCTLYAFFGKYAQNNIAANSIRIFALTAAPVFSLVFSIAVNNDQKSVSIISVLICLIVVLTALLQSKNIFGAAFSAVSFFITIDCLIKFIGFKNAWAYAFAILIFAVLCFAGRFAKGKIPEFTAKLLCAMTCGVPIMMLLETGFMTEKLIDYTVFNALLMLCIVPILYCDFSQISRKNTYLLTVTVCFLSGALIFQPFWDFEDTFCEGKYYLIPIVLGAFALKYIWGKESFIGKNILFFAGLWSILSLSITAISSQKLPDAFFILSIALAMLIFSFIYKQKKWFLLSTVTLCTLSIYLSRKFDLKIGWWVYLLTAGIILIAVAAFNEYCKTKGESLKERAGRFWQEWTW